MQLHFKELGRGEPLVMLHGLFGSSDNWMGVAPRLAGTFHVFALDLRNHGRSPHSDEMSYSLMAQDVTDLLDSLGLRDVFLLGHSMGGKTAMQLALQQPDRIRKLVVVDMAPRVYKPVHEPIFAALLGLNLESFHAIKEIEEALAPTIPGLALRRFLLKNVGRNPDGSLFWKMNLRGVSNNYPRLNEPLAAEAPFEKPALFLRGGQSNHVMRTDEPQIRDLFPNPEFQTIEGATHWVHADAPDEFVRRVSQFIGGAS